MLILGILLPSFFTSCFEKDTSRPHEVKFYLGINGAQYVEGEVITPTPHELYGKVYAPVFEQKWFEDPTLTVVPLRLRVVVEVIDKNGFRQTYEVVATEAIVKAIERRSGEINANSNTFQKGVFVKLAPLVHDDEYSVHEIIFVDPSPS